MFMYLLTVSSFLCALFYAAPVIAAAQPKQQTPVEIVLSHQLDGVYARHMAQLVERFNTQYKDVQLVLARRLADDAPTTQINLLTREAWAQLSDRQAKFKPLYSVMREAKVPFDANKLSTVVRVANSDAQGRLLALPFAMSTPVLYINKTLFRQAGLDPEQPPQTWWETQQAAIKLLDTGCACPFTSAWPAWVQIDNMSAWNDADVSDSKGNFAFNGLAQIKHIALLSSWRKSKLFIYFGRRDEADRRFAAGECAMLTSTSSLDARLRADSKLAFGVARLPYYDDLRGAPRHTLADGSAFWVASGKSAAEYRGIARFIAFLLDTETQRELRRDGFLPLTSVTERAVKGVATEAVTDDVASKIARTQLPDALPEKSVAKETMRRLRTVRISQIEPVQRIVDDELEAVWENRKTAKQALDDAVMRANALPPAVRKAGYPQ